MIKFNQNAWLKPNIDMNTDIRKKAKSDFGKYFFKLINNEAFGKTMENVRKHEDTKLATTERRKNYLVSEPNYHTTKLFKENLIAVEIKKTEIVMNKRTYLGISILELSKILRLEFWYDYVKPKYGEKAKLCSINKENFVFIKTLQKMLKLDFILQIMNLIDHYKRKKKWLLD